MAVKKEGTLFAQKTQVQFLEEGRPLRATRNSSSQGPNASGLRGHLHSHVHIPTQT